MLRLVVPEGLTYLASHESALKAHRQSLKHREHNRQFRSRLRNALRSIRASIEGDDLTGAVEALFRTDIDLKRSAGEPRILLERLVVELCGVKGVRS